MSLWTKIVEVWVISSSGTKHAFLPSLNKKGHPYDIEYAYNSLQVSFSEGIEHTFNFFPISSISNMWLNGSNSSCFQKTVGYRSSCFSVAEYLNPSFPQLVVQCKLGNISRPFLSHPPIYDFVNGRCIQWSLGTSTAVGSSSAWLMETLYNGFQLQKKIDDKNIHKMSVQN